MPPGAIKVLNMRQIEAFRATVATQSVTGAGRLLNISQPSVTRLLNDLEAKLGFRLFVRLHRGMKPTEEARLFYAEVQRSFLGLQELQDAAVEIRENSRRKMVLGATPAVSLEFIPAAIAEFSSTHESVQIETHVSTSDRIYDFVRSARVSLAVITPFESVSEDLQVLVQREFPYVAVMPRDHPLARDEGAIEVTRIEEGTMISPPPEFLASRCRSDTVRREINRRTKITIDVSFPAAAMARHGLGVALVDPFTAMFFREDKELAIRAFVDGPVFPFILVQPNRLMASQLQASFVEVITGLLDRIGSDPG